ncbi:MAG: alpha/beta fold hydrolase [Phycisphaerales bacterium]
MTGLAWLFGSAGLIAVTAYVLLLARHLRHPLRRTAGWALARKRPADPGELEAHGGPRVAWSEDRVGPVPFWSLARDEATLASREAPSVILLHGWGHSRIDGLARLEPWLSRGFRIVLPDLRGHGDADGPSTLGDRDADDVVAIAETLPPSPLVLAGHSMGGVVAIRAGVRLSERTSSNAPQLQGVVAIAAYERLRVPAIADLHARGYSVGPLIHPLLAVLRLLGIREHSTRETASRLPVPLLVVHGERDASCPLRDAETFANAASRGTFVAIPDAGHNDLWREHGQTTVRALDEWIESLTSTDPITDQTNASPR